MPEEIIVDTTTTDLNRLKTLHEQIMEYDKQYYENDTSVITDGKYDELRREYHRLIDAYPDEAASMGIELGVGYTPSGPLPKVKHKEKLLSLDNTYTQDELSKFIESVRKVLPKGKNATFVGEQKIDGLAISFHYEKGHFKKAVTRGDGFIGEDVTDNVKDAEIVPMTLQEGCPDRLEIRGECYLSRVEFTAINDRARQLGKPLFSSPRNAASGILRRKVDHEGDRKRLGVFCYTIGSSSEDLPDTQWECLELLKEWGFQINAWNKLLLNEKAIIAYCDEQLKERDKLTYDIDGAVIKVNELVYQEELGATNRAPRWASAWKFPAMMYPTVLKDIVVQVGRLGTATPVGILEPVTIDGVVIKRATLHNADYIANRDLRIGDVVGVLRAGDVIPRIEKVLLDHMGDALRSAPFMFPKECPACQGPLLREEGESDYKCTNHLRCPAQRLERLVLFVHRDAVNIMGLSRKKIVQLLKAGLITTAVSIFDLPQKKMQLCVLDGWNVKSAGKLIRAIEAARTIAFDKFIYALQIDHVGRTVSRQLADYYKTPDNFFSTMFLFRTDEEKVIEDLKNMPNVGNEIISSLRAFFLQDENLDMADALRERLMIEVPKATIESPVTGKKIVFTGSFAARKRKDWEALVRELGATVVNSVSKSTDYVVVGMDPGSKQADAIKYGATLIDEFGLKELLGI